MRILFVLSIGHMSGGAAVVWMNLLDGLAKRGFESYVIMPQNKDDTMLKELDARGIPHTTKLYTWWTTPDSNPHSLYRKTRRLAARVINGSADKTIEKIIVENKIDLVFINDGTITAGLKPAKKHGIPVVWHFHEVIDGNAVGTQYIDNDEKVAATLKQADRIISVSKYIANILQERFGLEEKPLCVYNGTADERVGHKENGILKGDRQVITLAARVDANKGQMEAVEAFSMIADEFPNAILQIVGVGDPEYAASVKAKAESLPCSDRIFILGLRNDMADIWKGTDISLNCSYHEGCPMVIVEALCSGCLMVGSTSPGNTELLLEGQSLVYERRNAADLAEKLRWALSNPEEAAAMAERAREWATHVFDVDVQCDTVAGVFNELLS